MAQDPDRRDVYYLLQLSVRVLLSAIADPPKKSRDQGITCDIVNDLEWWPRNGYSEAERQAFCELLECDC